MTEKGCKVTFNKSGLKVFLEGNTIATAELSIRMVQEHVLDGEPHVQEDFAHVAQAKTELNIGVKDWVTLVQKRWYG